MNTLTVRVHHCPKRTPPLDVRYRVNGTDTHLPARDIEEVYAHLSVAFAQFQGLPTPPAPAPCTTSALHVRTAKVGARTPMPLPRTGGDKHKGDNS